MINRQHIVDQSMSDFASSQDIKFLFEKIHGLQQELSDLTFEFNRAFDDRRRTS